MHSCSTEVVFNHPSVFIRVYLFYMFLSVSIGFVICFISFISFFYRFTSVSIYFYLFTLTSIHCREKGKKTFWFHTFAFAH